MAELSGSTKWLVERDHYRRRCEELEAENARLKAELARRPLWGLGAMDYRPTEMGGDARRPAGSRFKEGED